jgi:5-formyltetrahydrofolate cyclo-ligase
MLNTGPNKMELRRALLATRRAIAPALRAEWDAQIGRRGGGGGGGPPPPVRLLGVYWPIQGEPDLRPDYAELARQGVALALPVVRARDTALGYVEWVPGEELAKDQFGVPVPERQRLVRQPDALLVPCVGFNAQRFRLGYGAGFYDRTLAQPSRGAALGVAYACAAAEFGNAAHDVALDLIITETLILPEGALPP